MNERQDFVDYIYGLQDDICATLESVDAKVSFHEDKWKRPEGGGGITRVLSDGQHIEKAGVNTSVIEGKLNAALKTQLKVEHEDFFACGISLVIHPRNPMAPTIHMNLRYFELFDEEGNEVDSWFGGGIDLTPYYLFEEDAIHLHSNLKQACDPFGPDIYPKFKARCDEYFYNSHRGEMRGIGGIFFDYIRSEGDWLENGRMGLMRSIGDSFLPIYQAIIERRKALPYTNEQRRWQEVRRGRYVEFNLLHDKGTIFGIRSNGRTESILMSLPPVVRWDYDHIPAVGSREAHLVAHLQPHDWADKILLENNS